MRLGPKILLRTATVLGALMFLGMVVHPKTIAGGLITDKKYDKAEQTISSALENPLFKSDPTMFLKRAEAKRKLGDFKGSHADLDEALRLEQGNKILWGSGINGNEQLAYEIHLESAYGYEDEKQVDKALEETEKAAKCGEQFDLHETRARIFEQAKQFDKAENELNLAVDKAVSDDVRRLRIARAYFFWRQERLDEALKEMDAVLADEKTKDALADRGDMYMAKGDYKAALADFDAALELDSDYEDVQQHRKEAMEKIEARSP